MSRKFKFFIISTCQPDIWKVLVLLAITLLFLGSVFLVALKRDRINFDLNAKVIYSSKKTMKSNQVLMATNFCSFLLRQQCSIGCYSTTVSEIVAKSTYESCGNATVSLQLFKVLFENKTIAEGWLKEFPKTITDLTIESNNLYYLGKRSFAGDPFLCLDSLTLTNTNIVYLEKSSFEGMALISILQFRCEDYREINFETGALEPIAGNLSTLQINTCELKPQGLVNLTGSTNLHKLLTLDLRFNNISGIVDYAFFGTKNVEQLYLTSSRIKYMKKKSLAGLNNLIKFCIEGNELTTLQNGTFNIFQNNGNIRMITISDNPWNCNCDLQWLKDFCIQNAAKYFSNDSFQCKLGTNWKYYYEVDFCPFSTTTTKSATVTVTTTIKPNTFTTRDSTPQHTTTTLNVSTSTEQTTSYKPNYTTAVSSTSTVTDFTTKYSTLSTISIANTTTTISSITTTPSNGNNNINVLCRDNFQNPPIDMRLSRSYSHSVLIRNGTITYDFYSIVGTPNYDIFLENSRDADYLLYINVNDHEDMGCIFNVQNKVSLSRLKHSESYILCLLNKNKVEVSPFDCTSLHVPPLWGDMPWVFNKDKTLVIILVTISLLSTAIITATIIYITIKKNPKLIRVFRKFLVQESRFQEKEYGRITPLSFYSTSDGYLTPKLSVRRNYQLDTISENDIGGINMCTASKCSTLELQTPPQLPPNHPNFIIARDEHITPFIPIV